MEEFPSTCPLAILTTAWNWEVTIAETGLNWDDATGCGAITWLFIWISGWYIDMGWGDIFETSDPRGKRIGTESGRESEVYNGGEKIKITFGLHGMQAEKGSHFSELLRFDCYLFSVP